MNLVVFKFLGCCENGHWIRSVVQCALGSEDLAAGELTKYDILLFLGIDNGGCTENVRHLFDWVDSLHGASDYEVKIILLLA